MRYLAKIAKNTTKITYSSRVYPCNSLQFHDFPAAHFDEINTDTLLQLAPMSLETWSDATKLGFKVVKTIMVNDVETKIESDMFEATKAA